MQGRENISVFAGNTRWRICDINDQLQIHNKELICCSVYLVHNVKTILMS